MFQDYKTVGKKLHVIISYEELNKLIPWLDLSTRFGLGEKRELILNFLPENVILINDPKVDIEDEIYNIFILDLNKNPDPEWKSLYEKFRIS